MPNALQTHILADGGQLLRFEDRVEFLTARGERLGVLRPSQYEVDRLGVLDATELAFLGVACADMEDRLAESATLVAEAKQAEDDCVDAAIASLVKQGLGRSHAR